MTTAGSLYFHLPFCRKKCPYCHFFVVKDDENAKEALFQALKRELFFWKPLIDKWRLSSLYFGGGTPSLFGPKRIAALIALLDCDNLGDLEITLEANPDDVTEPMMRAYANAGINRVSIGVQSFDDTLLRHLGRLHDGKAACEAVEAVARAGIDNITIDLMYDLPDQSLLQWKESLHTARSLPISHLSIYNLTLEPGTPFHRKKEQLLPRIPEEALSTTLYRSIKEVLFDFEQYEISAFAREGKRSIHNSGYWKGRPFIGLGPSAFSYLNGWRFSNAASMPKYLQAINQAVSPVAFREKLNAEGRKRELFAVGLRLKEGVGFDFSLKQEIDDLQKMELLLVEDQIVRLTEKGILMYDSVAEKIIQDPEE